MDDRKQVLPFLAILSFAALYFGFGWLYALDKRDTGNVLYEAFRSKVLAADETPGDARILLSGGSNVIWGFRSQVIEEGTGIPTFNLGLIHEAYDPSAMRKLTLSAVRPGDTVVYASVSFWNSRSTDPLAAREILKVAGLDDEEYWSLQTFKRTMDRYWSAYPQTKTIITSLPALWERYFLRKRGAHTQDLNPKGDLAGCQAPGTGGPNSFVAAADPLEFLRPLQEFQDALRKRGASLVLMLPPTLIIPDEKNKWIEGYAQQVQAMQDHFMMATPSVASSLYTDPALFCDTGFHLADAEAAARSRRLADFLNERRKTVGDISRR